MDIKFEELLRLDEEHLYTGLKFFQQKEKTFQVLILSKVTLGCEKVCKDDKEVQETRKLLESKKFIEYKFKWIVLGG